MVRLALVAQVVPSVAHELVPWEVQAVTLAPRFGR